MEQIRVLIVDDEVDFAATLADRLGMRGYAASYSTSGEGAVSAIGEARPDVVVLDVQMPDVNGLEVLSMIKNLDPSIEVILLTGHASVNAGIDGMERGAFDYTVKPVDLNMLQAKIDDACQLMGRGAG